MAAFDNLFQSTPTGEFIDYSLPYPKWQFLTYLCEAHELVQHGSQNLSIRVEQLLGGVQPRLYCYGLGIRNPIKAPEQTYWGEEGARDIQGA